MPPPPEVTTPGPARSADPPPPPRAWDVAAVLAWLAGLRNDLEAPAVARAPAIAEALAEAAALPGVRLARMSGSGATVFALFETTADSAAAAARLTANRPGWWIRPTNLG